MRSATLLSGLIKKEAERLDFEACGISPVDLTIKENLMLNTWIRMGFHGKMQYMDRNIEKRNDLSLLVEGAKSVISVIKNYNTSIDILPGQIKISKYAAGRDYHSVIKDKLTLLFEFIKEIAGDINGRIFTDSAPVFERVWAERSGLGWIGKNTNLINEKYGSFVFLGEIILDRELKYDNNAVRNRCGSCTKCIDSCPTQAIVEPYVIDSRKCISYLTIELKDDIPDELKDKLNGWIFGCDICQQVCPWNTKAPAHNELEFEPSVELVRMNVDDWKNLDEKKFKALFKHTAISRVKYEKMMNTIKTVLKGAKK